MVHMRISCDLEFPASGRIIRACDGRVCLIEYQTLCIPGFLQ